MSVPERTGRKWRKSSHSGTENCVEVDDGDPSIVGVRDSKAPIDALNFRAVSWKALIKSLKK